MKTICFAWALLLLSVGSFAQNTNVLLSKYLNVKDALIKGDSKMAAQASSTFQQSLNEDGSFAKKENLVKATNKLATATTIDQQRAAFNDVSTAMWTFTKGVQSVSQPVYYTYCPMKKTYWLSREKDIENPYYGSAMLTCGKVVEIKK